MIVVVLNGWSSSVRSSSGRISSVVSAATSEVEKIVFSSRATLGGRQARKAKRFILKHQDKYESLLCVGKSLGAKQLICKVLNKLPALEYRKVGLFTVDPCWPLWYNWAPNLNNKSLNRPNGVTKAYNFYAVLPPNQQAGARVAGADNFPLTGVDHYSIVRSDRVRRGLQVMVSYLVV